MQLPHEIGENRSGLIPVATLLPNGSNTEAEAQAKRGVREDVGPRQNPRAKERLITRHEEGKRLLRNTPHSKRAALLAGDLHPIGMAVALYSVLHMGASSY